jgi:hypothetical protein
MHSKAMVDRQNRITPILSSENMVRWNFGDRYAAPYIDTADAASFKRTIHLSQVAQADCVRAETQHYRRGRDTKFKTGGSTYWMLEGMADTHTHTRTRAYFGSLWLLFSLSSRVRSLCRQLAH